MNTTEIVSIEGHQAVKLPDEYRFNDATVSIRKEGDAVILEPVRVKTWPAGFFDDMCRVALPGLGQITTGSIDDDFLGNR